MRIICKVVGNNKCFHLEAEVKKGFGFDTPATTMFAESLCNSLNRQMDVCAEQFRGMIGSNEEYQTNASRITRKLEKDKYGLIYVDVSVERRKGRQIPFCRISIDDAESDVRTTNLLPDIARFVYKTVYLLRRMDPPRGMEILRSIEIIRNFNDPRALTHELYIEDGTVKEREKQPKTKN